MRQITTSIDPRTKAGYVKLEANDEEDMWHVYNLLAPGDLLRTSTIRKVQQLSSTGSSTSERLRLTLSIKITSFAYDASAVNLRVAGQVVVENDHVRVGAFHTLELQPHRAFTLTKQLWDSVYMQRLQLALNPAADADVAAIVMQEGLAHLLLVSRSLTITRARVETQIPRKGKNAIYNRSSAIDKFFDSVLSAWLTHLDIAKLKVLLIASPGFVKDEFFNYAMLEASRRDLKDLVSNKSKIILCHASSGYRHAFQEILTRPELQSRLQHTKAVGEVRTLNSFHDKLNNDPDKAVYGPIHVQFAADMAAIDTLLVTDTLFRATDTAQRTQYVALVEQVKASGAQVVVFSAKHVSGEELDLMSGVAAILRFPLAGLDDLQSQEE